MKKRAVVTDLNKHIKESPDMQKLLHKRRKTHRIIFILIAIIAVALCIGTIVFLCNKTVQIYSITVSGNEIIDSDVVVSDIQHSLTGKYLYLIPKTNIFFWLFIIVNINHFLYYFTSLYISCL